MSKAPLGLLLAVALSTIVVGAGVALLANHDILYEVSYVSVTGLGLVLSVFYLTTWGYWAFRVWRKGLLKLGTIPILEFIIVPVISVPSFGLAIWTTVSLGFPVMPAARVSRLLFAIVLLLVIVLRTLNWVLRWRDHRREEQGGHGSFTAISSV